MSLITAALMAAAVVHAGKPANCDIWYRNAVAYQGRCNFAVDRGGSFALTFPIGDSDITEKKIGSIVVRMVGPGLRLSEIQLRVGVRPLDRSATRRAG